MKKLSLQSLIKHIV